MEQEFPGVVDLDAYRRNSENRPVQVVAPLEVAPTGAQPVKCLASDEHIYWCKSPNSAHGVSAVVNETVASIVGEKLGAPVREWRIIHVPADIAGTMVPASSVRMHAGPMFGSLCAHTVDESDVLKHIDRDNNYERIPKLIALWLLCNAEDIQMMFDFSGDWQIWSLDHGFWFGSHEVEWGLGWPDELKGRPELPLLRQRIPDPHWQRAIESVRDFPDSLGDLLKVHVPDEWDVPEERLEILAHYVLKRRDYAIDQLEVLQQKHKRMR